MIVGFILIFIITLSVFLKLLLLGGQISNVILLTNTLDFSWQTDNVERLLHGYIAGRDFIFTYGPLFQFIYAIPALIFGQSSYISVLYAPILITVFCVILLYFIIKLITKDRNEQIILTCYLFFFIGLIAYDSNTLFRILLTFFYSLLLLRFDPLKNTPTLKNLAIFILPPIFGMYSFDILVTCLMISVLFIIYKIYTTYHEKNNKRLLRKLIFISVIQIGLIIFIELIISFLISGSFNYLVYSLDTIKNYQYVMNLPLSFNRSTILFLFPIALTLLLIYAIRKTRIKKNIKQTFIFLTLVALIQLKSAFIRPDEDHIIMGIYPSLIILFILFYFILREKLRLIIIFIFLIFYILIPFKENYYSNISIKYFKLSIALATENISFFDIYKLTGDYSFTKYDFQYFESLIKDNPQNVLVYPYDSYLLNIYSTTFNTLPLQFYEYSSSIVEKKAVEKLSGSPPKYIILSIDSISALSLDDIPNFSRNPLVTKWIFSNYSVYENKKKYLILIFQPDKKIQNSNDTDCKVYDIDTRDIIKNSYIESAIKPSSYYLKNPMYIKLPYTNETKKVFIVENYENADKIETLIERNINFNKKNKRMKKLIVVKKFAIPGILKSFSGTFQVDCY